MARYLVLALFFASGASALVYQIVWQRLLAFVTGADADSATIIVAGFMAGLGLGSLAGGHVADRLTDRARYWAFAVCELAIALFALVSVAVFYDLLARELGSLHLSVFAKAALSFGATLWPTFFMGASLPLAARIVTRDPQHPAKWVAILYGWNTVGSAVGAVLAVSVLLPWLAADHILRAAAVVNAACAVAAWGLAWLPARPEVSGAAELTPSGTHSRASKRRLGLWMAAFALSGFVALSLEIVWFRLAGVMLKSNALTFGYLLGWYLGGLGLGSLAAGAAAFRRWPPARSFFVLQAAIPICAIVTVSLLVKFVGVAPGTGQLWLHLASYDGLSGDTPAVLAAMLGVAIPVLIISLPTFLMGLSYGSLQTVVQTELGVLGRRVGWVQAAGIAGAAIGALATGFVFLDWLGTSGTLRVLAVPGGVFLWLAVRESASLTATAASLTAALVAGATFLVVPTTQMLWSRLHGIADNAAIVREDGSGVAVLKPGDGGTVVVFANGLGQSELPYGHLHTLLGALPLVLHPNPVSVAVIGLGSGDTVFSLGGRPETRRIDSIEIVAPVLDALRELGRASSYQGLHRMLGDARITHHLADGRAFLAKTLDRYDVIEADALRPSSAHAGHLYSVEYFALLRERLNPGGFAVTWVPTERVRETIRAVFPYVTIWGEIAIASEAPIVVDLDMVRARVSHPYTQAHFRAAGIDLQSLLDMLLQDVPIRFTPANDRPLAGDLNEDLHPRDEFSGR